jgi:hypothetical protein
MMVSIFKTTWRHVPEASGSNLHSHPLENLKFLYCSVLNLTFKKNAFQKWYADCDVFTFLCVSNHNIFYYPKQISATLQDLMLSQRQL